MNSFAALDSDNEDEVVVQKPAKKEVVKATPAPVVAPVKAAPASSAKPAKTGNAPSAPKAPKGNYELVIPPCNASHKGTFPSTRYYKSNMSCFLQCCIQFT